MKPRTYNILKIVLGFILPVWGPAKLLAIPNTFERFGTDLAAILWLALVFWLLASGVRGLQSEPD